MSENDLLLLRQRLGAVMKSDVHQDGDYYEIRSVYFDDIMDTCFNDNESGVDQRKKFRIRIYNGSDSAIRLEIKEKLNGLNRKNSCALTKDEYYRLLSGGQGLDFGERIPLNQLLLLMRTSKMQPKTIVVYKRSAFVHPSGNVRITFDRNIGVSRKIDSFFDERVCGTIPMLPTGFHILEIKYDEFLPDIISQQLELGKLRQTTFSKYYLGRKAINGEIYSIF